MSAIDAQLRLPDERRPPISPQLALRVAILGGFAIAMFAIIFFRLWFLQVLSGEQYVAQANDNRVRDVPIPAPRGDILDRDGQLLVDSRTTHRGADRARRQAAAAAGRKPHAWPRTGACGARCIGR